MNEYRRQYVAAILVILCIYLECVSSEEIFKIPLKSVYSLNARNHNHRISERAAVTLSHKVVKRQLNNLKGQPGMVTLSHKVVKRQLNNLKGQPGMGYYIEMGIGSPPQLFNILVDTGSSNFAVAASPDNDISHYFNSTMSKTYNTDDSQEVYVPYTQGKWTGLLAHEHVSIPSLPSINVSADIAFITESSMFFQNGSHWQGILGLAYSEIVRPDSSVEVFMDTLKKQAPIPDMFSMQLCGVIDLANQTDVNTGGTLIFGGLDESLYKGDIKYSPIYKEWYYEVIITDISIGGQSIGLECKEYNFDKTIVDSGTTNLRLPRKVFGHFVDLVKRHTKAMPGDDVVPTAFWLGQSVLCWPQFKTPWQDFPSVSIELAASADSTFKLLLSPQQYMREVDDQYDDTALNDCFKFAVSPSETGTVIGAVVMEGYYVIFDREGKRVGFAQTTCPNTQPNVQPSKLSDIQHVIYNTSQCAYIKPETNLTPLTVAAYIMAGLCVLCLVPLVLFVFQCQYHRRCRKKRRNDDFVIDDNQLLEPNGSSNSRKYYSSFNQAR